MSRALCVLFEPNCRGCLDWNRHDGGAEFNSKASGLSAQIKNKDRTWYGKIQVDGRTGWMSWNDLRRGAGRVHEGSASDETES